ncbi:MAG: sulfite exporter TauE/SafE family protein [Pusillimonas sp.]|nr:sulfite exporter TauE/SafE family protein [Pusillimonas sp.]
MLLAELDWTLLVWIGVAAIFIVGGIVKGTMGVGLPTVVLPMLSLLVPGTQAMGLLVMPVLSSNFWQAIEGGNWRYSLRRFGSLIGTQLLFVVLTVKLTAGFSIAFFNVVVAIAVLSSVALMFVRPQKVRAEQERWMGPLVGLIAGVMGGASSLTGPIIITYLMALRLKREEFIASISIIYLLGSVPMYVAMLWYGRFGFNEVALSVLALLPMFAGLRFGKAIRQYLSEMAFRRVLTGFLVILALMLVLKSI